MCVRLEEIWELRQVNFEPWEFLFMRTVQWRGQGAQQGPRRISTDRRAACNFSLGLKN